MAIIRRHLALVSNSGTDLEKDLQSSGLGLKAL